MTFTSARLPRDVRLAALARAVSAAGDEMAIVALLLHLARTADGRGVAAALMAGAVPLLVLAPWAGLLADRLPTRTALVGTGLVQAAAAAALAGALVVGAPLGALLVLVAAISCAQALAGPAWSALVPTLVPPDEVPRAVGAVQSAMTASLVVAPAMAGFLVGTLGAAWPLLLDAWSFLVVVVAALLLRHPRVPAPRGQTEKPSAWEGFRVIGSDPVLGAVVVMLVLFVLALGAVNVVEVLLLTVALGASPTVYGVVGAVFALGMLAGNQLAGRAVREATQARLLVVGAAVLTAAIALVGAAPSVAVAGAASAVVGVGNGVLSVSGQVITVRRSPDEVRGRVFAALGGAYQAACVGALVLGGLLVGILGARGVFFASAAACAATLILTAPRLLRRTAPAAGWAPQGAPAVACAEAGARPVEDGATVGGAG